MLEEGSSEIDCLGSFVVDRQRCYGQVGFLHHHYCLFLHYVVLSLLIALDILRVQCSKGGGKRIEIFFGCYISVSIYEEYD